MTIRLHRGDLPDLSAYKGAVAIDTETMGLDPNRDRLCVVQLSPGDGSADVVQIAAGTDASAPNIERLLADQVDPQDLSITRRFDLGVLAKAFGVMAEPVYCTKIASRLARTYTDKHGLKDLAREVLGVDLSKQQQSSDWGADELTDAQVAYAATDVLHLHALKEKLDAMLAREGRAELAARLLPLPARPGAPRPRRLGGRGYFFAFGVSCCIKAVFVNGRLPRRGHIRAPSCVAGRKVISETDIERSRMPILA